MAAGDQQRLDQVEAFVVVEAEAPAKHEQRGQAGRRHQRRHRQPPGLGWLAGRARAQKNVGMRGRSAWASRRTTTVRRMPAAFSTTSEALLPALPCRW